MDWGKKRKRKATHLNNNANEVFFFSPFLLLILLDFMLIEDPNAFYLLFPSPHVSFKHRLTRLRHPKNMYGDEGERKWIRYRSEGKTKVEAIEIAWLVEKEHGFCLRLIRLLNFYLYITAQSLNYFNKYIRHACLKKETNKKHVRAKYNTRSIV